MSYRTRPGTGEAGGLLVQTTAASSMKMLRKLAAQLSVLIFDLISLAAGVAIIAADHQTILTLSSARRPTRTEAEFITIFGFVLLGLYIKVADWRRHCVWPCILSKKQGLAWQLQGNSGCQILTLNLFTDPMVYYTQYAPVSDILARQKDEERRNLMSDIKQVRGNRPDVGPGPEDHRSPVHRRHRGAKRPGTMTMTTTTIGKETGNGDQTMRA